MDCLGYFVNWKLELVKLLELENTVNRLNIIKMTKKKLKLESNQIKIYLHIALDREVVSKILTSSTKQDTWC